MDLQSRRYEKIAIFNITGEVTSTDVVSLGEEIPKICKGTTFALLVLEKVKIAKAVAQELVALCEAKQREKPSFILISSQFEWCHAKDLVSALDHINTAESDRIVHIFTQELEFNKLKEKLKGIELEAARLLASALRMEASTEPMTPEQFDVALVQLEDRNRKLRHLSKVWSAEIAALRKQRGKLGVAAKGDPEALERLNLASARALKVVRKG